MLNIPYFKSSTTTTNAVAGGTTASPDRSHNTMNPNASEGGGTTDGDDKTDAMETETTTTTTVVGHPSLPSIESVATVASRLINECPPFISMSVRDTAPQLKLEDPPDVFVLDKTSSDPEGGVNSSSNNNATIDFRRRLVVKGGMKGYRMSRTTHGVSSGCYYYEAVILGSEKNDIDNESDRGVKRSHDETNKEDTTKETNESSNENDSEPKQKKQKTNATVNSTTTTTRSGHVRVGWSTRLADLQAPVGYNEHSYGIRDIQGSRIHKSRREDTWGGIEFGPGDVIGCAIIFCLGDKKAAAASNSSLLANPNGNSNSNNGETTTQKKVESTKEGRSQDAATSSGDGKDAAKLSSTTLANHIRFFKNGEPMGKDGIAFDNITPGTYHPSISCYMDGASQLNFGPRFVYPPTKGGILPVAESLNNIRPISELCTSPPLPEDAIDKVLTGDGSKEGKKIFFSKRTDDGIVSAFKELVKTESTIRWDAHVKHLELHRREVMALRKERGLDIADLEESSMQLS